jgi:hypothetical protein
MNLYRALFRTFQSPPFLIITSLVCSSLTSVAQVNSWTSFASGHWDDPSWSLGIPPAANQSVMIINSGSKAVGIFAGTAVGSMTVSNLTISGPVDTVNTLLLNFFGTNTPLRALKTTTIQANGRILNLFSGFQIGVDGGDLVITNGSFEQEGGVTIATNGATLVSGGTMALTNAAFAFQSAHLLNSAVFIQSGGNIGGSNLAIHSGSFNLLSGQLSASEREVVGLGGGGIFNQYGGTNRSDIYVGEGEFGSFSGGNGHYMLFGGQIESTQLVVGSSAPASGDFTQNGGTVSNQNLRVGGFNSSSSGAYMLNAGVLMSGNVSINNGHVFQSGGQHSVSANLSLSGFFVDYGPGTYFANYTLQNGFLNCGSISQGLFGSINQINGTNNVSGNLSLNQTTYSLSGGTLSTSNTFLGPGGLVAVDAFVPTDFLQSAGLHRITNTLTCAGIYHLDVGTLIAPAVILTGRIDIGPSPAATMSNATSVDLGGTISLHSSTQHLAVATLSGNSTIDFNSGNCQLTFANSSALAWAAGKTLTVSNWNGLVSGGGTDELFFGATSSDLTLTQLAQIRFVNPTGFPAGVWFAKLLPTGEVVPTTSPLLLARRSGTSLILEWPSGNFVLQAARNLPGPFMDLSVSSPFTNDTTQFPHRFFRLRL